MFNEIGKKIKTLASVIVWVAVIAAFILVINLSHLGEEATVIGIIFGILFVLLAWVGSFMLYGFGDMVDKISHIDDTTRRILTEVTSKNQAITAQMIRIGRLLRGLPENTDEDSL